jgi:hypothetical protein
MTVVLAELKAISSKLESQEKEICFLKKQKLSEASKMECHDNSGKYLKLEKVV